MDRGTRAWSRAGFGMAVLGSTALLIGVACLPDLDPFPDEPEASAGESTASPYCGDGVIETLEDGGDSGESCDPGDASTSTAGCEDCRLTCAGTLDPQTGHCYFLADPRDYYGDALDVCRGARAHVVTIGSGDEQRFVAGLDAGAHWIGLATQFDGIWVTPPGVDEPGWPRTGTGCSGCYALTDDAGAFPQAPLPDGGSAPPTGCLAFGTSTWLQVPCKGVQRPTLCEREPLGTRLEPCGGALCTTLVVPDAGAKRYVVWPSPASAAEAVKTCVASGGSLVMFDSREEREQLARELGQRLGSESLNFGVWIGLSRAGDTWTWDDGMPLQSGRPLPWGDGQPSGQGTRAFMIIDQNHYDTQLARTDEDASSNEKRVFVCQRRAE